MNHSAQRPAIRGQFSHPSTDIPSTPLPELAPGSTYACCVAPFTAVADSTSGFSSTGKEDAATVTVRVPGRGRLTLPMWFAEEYVTSITIPAAGNERIKVAGCGETRIMVPNDKIDEHQPVFATQMKQHIPGWREVAVFGSQNAPQPPALTGTPSERSATVHAKASVILDDCDAVQHAVIPRLVFQHVVCPFATMIKCTVAQACLGVTTLETDLDFPLSKAPHVTHLSVDAIPVPPLPPRTQSLIVRKAPSGPPFLGHGLMFPQPQRNILQDSVCGLTSLEFNCSIYVGQLGATPMPTLRKLVLHTLQHHTGANSEAAIRQVSSLTPNVSSLTFGEDAGSWDDLMPCFAANADSDAALVWPHATALDYAGSRPSATVVACTRPWRMLVLRIVDNPRGSPHPDVERFVQAALDKVVSKLSDSLLELSIHFPPRGGIPTPESLDLLTSLCPNFLPKKLRSLTVPRMRIAFPPDRTASEFFAQAQQVENLYIHHFDVGSNNNTVTSGRKRADPFDDEVTAAFNDVFPASLRCVSTCRSSCQWKRTGAGEDARWRSEPPPAAAQRHVQQCVPQNIEHTAQQPSQVVLVAE